MKSWVMTKMMTRRTRKGGGRRFALRYISHRPLSTWFSWLDIREVAEEEELAKLLPYPLQAIFEKLTGDSHLQLEALYMNGFIYEKLTRKMLVDGDAAVSVMGMTTYRKINKVLEGLWRPDFRSEWETSVEITIGSKNMPITFFFY